MEPEEDFIDDNLRIVTEDRLYWLMKKFHNYTFVYSYQTSNEENKGKFVSSWEVTMSAVYGAVILFGLSSNLCVLKAVISVMKRRANCGVDSVLVYILSLTILNLFIMLSVPMTVLDISLGYWPFPNLFCQFHWLFESLNKSMVSVILSFLTVSCYCAVCHPEMKKIYRSRLWSALNVITAFVVQVALSLPAVKNSDIYYFLISNNESNVTVVIGRKCLFDPTADVEVFKFTLCSFLCGYVIPIITMSVCYGSILYTIRYRSPFPRHRVVQFRRVFRSVFLLVCFYLGSWTPYWTVTLVLYLNDGKRHESSSLLVITAFIVHLLPYVNCSCSTLLYSLFNKQIRTALKHPMKF